MPTTTTPTSSTNANLTKLVVLAAATAATLGYDVGIMAAAIQPLQADMGLTNVQKEVATGSLNFVAALGALLGGHVANAHGRKATIQLCGWLFVVGTFGMALAPNFVTFLLVGRIVTGLGVGVSFVVAPVFLSEVAPSDQRGALNTVFDVAINGGILLGYIVGFVIELIPFWSDSLKWRIMLGLGVLLPFVILYYLAELPESPRYLVMKQQTLQAQEVLRHLGESDPEGTVQRIEEELQSAPNMPTASDIVSQLFFQGKSTVGIRLALGLGVWQQITGTEAVLYYSADFLQQAGLQSATQRLLGNVLVGICKLTPELYAMNIVDTVGRRPLMLTSAVSLCISMALLALAFHWNWSPYLVVFLLCAIMASFSIGLGPFSFLIASEMLGLSERATGMTLCASVNRLTSGAVALTAVSLYQALGGSGFFLTYALIGSLSLPFYFIYLPETSGVTLEELSARNREEALGHHSSFGIEAAGAGSSISESNHSINGSSSKKVQYHDSGSQNDSHMLNSYHDTPASENGEYNKIV